MLILYFSISYIREGFSFLQTQEKRKKERKRRKSIRRKERKKEGIHDLRTQIFVPLLYKFKVNSMIIMYKNS